jgi:membrane carboxypeptidase/penicillin-binding protein PbpC
LTASSPYTQDFTITVSAPVVPDGSAYFYVRFTGPGSNDISVNGDIKLSKSDANYSSLTISVEYPGDYDAFRWLVDGTALDGETEGSVTLYASDYTTGTYWLTVIAEKAGVPYSRRFPFAVVN